MQHFQLISRLRDASARRRLWLGAVALALFIGTLVVGNAFIPREKSVTREMLGHDFLAFYTAGTFVRDGRYRELYNLESVKTFEQATSRAAGLEVGSSFGPWWNPPFYALVFEPLAGLPYPTALNVWRWISVAAAFIAISILASFVSLGWRHWALVPVLIVVSMPFIQALSHGQNTFTSLLLLVTTVALWRGRRPALAGLVCGLLFYKPQLAAVVAAAMVVDLGWTALAGLCVTGAALLIVTLVVMPGTIGDFLHLLPANVRWMQVEHVYLWERHVTLRAFWRLLLQGREAGEMRFVTSALAWASMLAAVGAMAWVAVKDRRYVRRLNAKYLVDVRRDRCIAATVAVMPLVMPFYFDYDLLLLAVPVTLYAAERVNRPHVARPSDVWLTRAWVALFLWLFVNPGFAMRTHVNVTVVVLSCVAGLLVARAGRAGVAAVAMMPDSEESPAPLALAA